MPRSIFSRPGEAKKLKKVNNTETRKPQEMEPNQQQNTRLSSVQSDIKAYLKAQVQEEVKLEEDNLRSQLQIGGAQRYPSIEMSKGTLRVLYAFLQGDKHKCLAAINSVRKRLHRGVGWRHGCE